MMPLPAMYMHEKIYMQNDKYAMFIALSKSDIINAQRDGYDY